MLVAVVIVGALLFLFLQLRGVSKTDKTPIVPQPVASKSEAPSNKTNSPSPVQKTVVQEQQPAVPLPSSFNYAGPIRIFFDFNRSNVNKNVYCIFDLIQSSLVKNAAGRIKIRVEGNADSIGPSWYNVILSQRRAERVIDSLSRRLAIPRDRFEIVANGSTKPVSPNSTSEGRSNNRRVEVSVF